MNDLISIARIIKTRGVKGEVAAELLTDFPERFTDLREVLVEGTHRRGRETLESHWFHKGRVILKFRGWDSPEAASELVGADLKISEADRVPLPDGSFYDSDLIGCRILEDERELGRVSEVLRIGPGVSNLVVRDGDREWMLPLAREFIREVDLEKKSIQVQLPPGLLELSAPVANMPGKRKQRRAKRTGNRG